MKKESENSHFKVYRRQDVLSRWHFKNNPRIPPMFLLADPHYGFEDLLHNFTDCGAVHYDVTCIFF